MDSSNPPKCGERHNSNIFLLIIISYSHIPNFYVLTKLKINKFLTFKVKYRDKIINLKELY